MLVFGNQRAGVCHAAWWLNKERNNAMANTNFLNRLLTSNGASAEAQCTNFVRWERRTRLLETPFDGATIGEAQGVYIIALDEYCGSINVHPTASHITPNAIYVGSVGTFTKSTTSPLAPKTTLAKRLVQFQESAKCGNGNHAGGNSFYEQFDWPKEGEGLAVALWPVAAVDSEIAENSEHLKRVIGLLEALCITGNADAKYTTEDRYSRLRGVPKLLNKRIHVPDIFGNDHGFFVSPGGLPDSVK